MSLALSQIIEELQRMRQVLPADAPVRGWLLSPGGGVPGLAVLEICGVTGGVDRGTGRLCATLQLRLPHAAPGKEERPEGGWGGQAEEAAGVAGWTMRPGAEAAPAPGGAGLPASPHTPAPRRMPGPPATLAAPGMAEPPRGALPQSVAPPHAEAMPQGMAMQQGEVLPSGEAAPGLPAEAQPPCHEAYPGPPAVESLGCPWW